MRYEFQWTFYSSHILCDRVPLGWEISSTLWNKSIQTTQAEGDSSHEYTTQCLHRQQLLHLYCQIGLAAPSVTDFILFLVLSSFQCEEEALLPHLLPLRNLFISTSPPPPCSDPPASHRTLKCGSQEMKGLRQVKLSSSPHRTFLVVIHSWQNPFTLWQPMSPLMYGVVSCHDPGNVHQGSCCLAPPLPPPDSVLNIALAQAGCDVGFGALFIYATALIHDKENALMGVSTRNLFKITRLRAMASLCEYEWRKEINVIASPYSLFLSLSLSCSLPLLFILISFSEHTAPAVSLSDLANAEWGQLQMNMIALSVFSDASMQGNQICL